MKNLIRELIQEIKKNRTVRNKIDLFYQEFKMNDFQVLGKNKSSGIVLSEIIVDYYTCIETLFVKISQYFENNLQKEKWHTDLLHKMTLEISDIRSQVISDKTHSILLELLRFRHFRRYYFEFDYDWDKLEYLEKKYNQVKGMVENDFVMFEEFLEKVEIAS
jgi:hypothetical protein